MENLTKIKDLAIRYLSHFTPIILYVIPSYLIFYNSYIHMGSSDISSTATALKIFASAVLVLAYFACISLILYGIILSDSDNTTLLFNAKRLETKIWNYYYVCDNYKITFYKKVFFGYITYMERNIKSYDSISIKNVIDEFYREYENDCEDIEILKKERKLKKLALEELENYGKFKSN